MKNVIKLPALAIFLAGYAALQTSATIVSFSFSGTVTYMNNPSNAVPAGIVYGSPMTGTMTYDTAAILNGADAVTSTNEGAYYFGTNGIFSISVTIGAHTFSNVPHTNQNNPGAIIIFEDFSGEDAFQAQDDTPYVRMDGGAFPGNADSGSIYIDLEDNSAAAYNNDSLPAIPPMLAQFPVIHRVEVFGSKNQSLLFDITSTVTNITVLSQPVLKIQAQPGKNLLLSWPLTAQGFGLQQNTNLFSGSGWQTNSTVIVDTATEHTVTVPVVGSMFFRLTSP